MHETALDCQRPLFSLPADTHYLNCAYMAPLARSVEQAGLAGLERTRLPSDIVADDFFAPSNRVRSRFAELIGAPSEGVALVPSVSYGLACVANNLPLQADREIVVAAGQFPSNYYPWSRRAREVGARLTVVEPPENRTRRASGWSQRLLEAIGPHTAIVALPQIHWSDGTRFDLAAIGARAREVGADLVLDVTQSAGALDLELDRVRPTAIVAAAYKSLFAPYGTAFAWLAPALYEGRPLEETWIARRGSEDFARLVDYSEQYRPGAARFDVGERSSPILIPMLEEALRLVASWGASRIQAYAAQLLEPHLEELAELGCHVEDARWRSAHLVGVRPPRGTDLEALRQELARRSVHVSIRGDAVRVSIQVFNDASDLEALVAALRSVLAG
ncbi:MAG: aminotransferase class V-fold PLP-dependent enzyme [Acidobacteria bacterium]|nr:MAG: aminotransferase class V-fold PLP-dependent enzyme [Acidobacteriota bacterium]REK00125.1 MAG: aminotransferase class V-fold PLP-dependent enzyme [Acidobacteriota bacterium]